jgi:hypothetical protein
MDKTKGIINQEIPNETLSVRMMLDFCHGLTHSSYFNTRVLKLNVLQR